MSEVKVEEKKVEPVPPQPAPAPVPQPAETKPVEASKVEAPKAETPKIEASFKAIVVTDTCGFCAGLKDYIKDKGLADKVKIINASTPEGRKFVIDNKIKGVPECIVVAEDGKLTRVCTKEEFTKLLKGDA